MSQMKCGKEESLHISFFFAHRYLNPSAYGRVSATSYHAPLPHASGLVQLLDVVAFLFEVVVSCEKLSTNRKSHLKIAR